MWMLCEPRRPEAVLAYAGGHEASQSAAERDSEHAVGRAKEAEPKSILAVRPAEPKSPRGFWTQRSAPSGWSRVACARDRASF